uniref:Integrase n=1 Tax=Anaerolinea thermolimosa TaxID=229919 RepID=A0A7C4KI47_9CHLR
MTTLQQAMERFLSVKNASPRTLASYRTGLHAFFDTLRLGRTLPDGSRVSLDPVTAEAAKLDEDWVATFIANLQDFSPATQNLYLAAVKGFYRFLLAERLASPHIPRIEQWIAERARKVPRRRPQFPREEIEQLIAYAESLPTLPVDSAGASLKSESSRRAAQQRARLRNMRDRALILLLADTGLRVSEACSLTLEDVNFFEGHLHVLGKGDKDDLVRVSQRALNALRDYLHERQAVGLSSPVHRGRPLSAGRLTPLFVRHDRAAGKGSPTPLDPSTAWDIIRERATEVLGGEAAHRIHPHSFRHYFVTIVLLATNNIEKARRLARHRSITTTQLYAEVDPELDRDYHEIFNTSRRTKV